MKEFIHVLRRFIPPYKKYLVLSIIFNILSAFLNIFSFATLIPLLQILFKVDAGTGAMRAMSWSEGSFKEVLSNNADYYTQIYITSWAQQRSYWPSVYSCLYDFPKDRSLFPFFCLNHSYKNRRSS